MSSKRGCSSFGDKFEPIVVGRRLFKVRWGTAQGRDLTRCHGVSHLAWFEIDTFPDRQGEIKVLIWKLDTQFVYFSHLPTGTSLIRHEKHMLEDILQIPKENLRI